MKHRINSTEGLAIKRTRGMTLLDVLLGIVIFVIGMLALAHLQTNLTRSSSDANTRTVATNVGEELLEELRSFQRVSSDPDGVLFAFADIDNTYVNRTVPRGGINYTVTADVWGYDFDSGGQEVSDPVAAVEGTVYDFKVVELNVAWDNNSAFQIDDEQDAISSSDMGTGSIQLSALIPSIPALSAAKVAARDLDALGNVPVDYTPGLRPDIVAIALDNNKFKESTTPEPDVIRLDEKVETWFDVITYLGQQDATFLRREEFLVVGCECELLTPSGDDGTGFLPTVWNGESYTEGEWVPKNYGASASNQNSPYCDVCCRDHHDSPNHAGEDNRFDPAREWTEAGVGGDHKHYNRSNQGALSEATQSGDNYLEICRMVRKDGFMRVAQDFRQEGFIAFPAGYLDSDLGAEAYSGYVTAAVKDFYENSRAGLTAPDGSQADGSGQVGGWTAFDPPADTPEDATTLPTGDGLDSQQLRSRGIYIDHVSAEALAIIECVRDNNPGECADAPGIDSYLEIFPFFEVQTTWLSWWTEDSEGNPVSVTNEDLDTHNAHSRGLAQKTSDAVDQVIVTTDMHRGNRGLAVVDPIDELDDDGNPAAVMNAEYQLYIDANSGGTTPPPPDGYTWSGTFVSGVNNVNAADATLTPGAGTVCQRSGTTLNCTTVNGQDGTLTISGYYKDAATSLWICGSGLTVTNGDPAAAVKSAVVSWPDGTTAIDIVLSIESSACN